MKERLITQETFSINLMIFWRNMVVWNQYEEWRHFYRWLIFSIPYQDYLDFVQHNPEWRQWKTLSRANKRSFPRFLSSDSFWIYVFGKFRFRTTNRFWMSKKEVKSILNNISRNSRNLNAGLSHNLNDRCEEEIFLKTNSFPFCTDINM